MNFYGVFEDGTVVYKDSLAGLLHLNEPKFLFKKELDSQRTTEYGKTYYNYKYSLIDSNGNTTTFKLGAFELVDILPEVNGYNDKCNIRYLLKNVNIGTIHEFDISEAYNLSFVYDKIIPMMEKLNLHGSYLAYQNALKLENVEKENAVLKQENKKLRNALKEISEIAKFL